MASENQFIGFTKWALKWLCISVLGLVLLGFVIAGVTLSYNYVTYDRHLKNIEVVAFNGALIDAEKFLDGIPSINKEQLRDIFFKEGIEKYRQARNEILKSVPALDEKKARHALARYLWRGEEERLNRAKIHIKEMREKNDTEENIINYIHSQGLTLEKLENHEISFEDLVPLKFCPIEFPIYVEYTNNTSKVIEYIEIDFSAHLPSRSTNILEWNAELKSDYIVEPGDDMWHCMNFPVQAEYKSAPNLENAIYDGKVSTVRFQKK